MSYNFSKTLLVGFDEAISRATEALKREGFGISTEIDVKRTLKAKIGVDFRNYRILSVCNPKLAHKVLWLEDKIGNLLPCNVVVQDRGGNHTEISAIDPVASMQTVDNPKLREGTQHVQVLLRQAIKFI